MMYRGTLPVNDRNYLLLRFAEGLIDSRLPKRPYGQRFNSEAEAFEWTFNQRWFDTGNLRDIESVATLVFWHSRAQIDVRQEVRRMRDALRQEKVT